MCPKISEILDSKYIYARTIKSRYKKNSVEYFLKVIRSDFVAFIKDDILI